MQDSVMHFFQGLGFEEIEIEDNLTALAVDCGVEGYAIISDDNGNIPESLNQFLIFAFYSPEGAYQWSTGFKTAEAFKPIWSKGGTVWEKCEVVRQYGENKGAD